MENAKFIRQVVHYYSTYRYIIALFYIFLHIPSDNTNIIRRIPYLIALFKNIHWKEIMPNNLA